MNATDNPNGADEPSPHGSGQDQAGRDVEAVHRAEAGTSGWEDAVRLQRWTTTHDHADFYALAGEMTATLRALDDLARVLGRQVAGYVHAQHSQGRQVYDDTRQRDPRHRLAEAETDLDLLADRLVSAEDAANSFWSTIGHIGVEEASR